MNARKSLTTAVIASVAFFSLFGAQAAHAAQDGNSNQQSESIEVALVAIGFYNAQEEVQDEAPGDDEITEEESAEEDAADDPIAEIVIPDPDTDNPINDTNDIEVNSNDSVVEAASIVEPLPTLKLLLRSTSLLTTPITTHCQPLEWNSPLHSLAWDSPALGERSSPCAVA